MSVDHLRATAAGRTEPYHAGVVRGTTANRNKYANLVLMASPSAFDFDGLIFGCGYLGCRVAARWIAAGRRVAALTRRNADALRTFGIEPITGDVLDPISLRALPRASTVLYAVGMDRAAGRTMREVYVDGLRTVLSTLPPPTRFIHVSSTGVYGQTDGGWIDETAATEPVEEAGRVVHDAERVLRAQLPGAVVLRFAGIYGPGRLLRKQPLLAGEPFVGDAGKWLNLVHVSDGADAVLAAESHATLGETYNVVDDEPVTRRTFYLRLAELLGAPPARFEPAPTAKPEPNRRVSNRKARERLGWSPRFPTYRDGLPATVAGDTV